MIIKLSFFGYRLRIGQIGQSPDQYPKQRSSWVIWTSGIILSRKLGYVNAKGHADAMRRAKAKWPQHRRLSAAPKQNSEA